MNGKLPITNHIKQAAILLFSLIALLPLVFALDISLNAPSEASVNEPFSVSISSDSSEAYDVKIYVKNSSDAVLSDIFNGTWKSSRYFINNAFPSVTSFNLRIEKYSEIAEICIKFRLSEKRSSAPTPEKCIPIRIINAKEGTDASAKKEDSPSGSESSGLKNDSPESNKSGDSQISVQNESKVSKRSQDKDRKNISYIRNDSQILYQDTSLTDPDINSQIITLNSKNIINKSNPGNFKSPQQNLRLYALYALTTLIFLVILLYLIKKI